MPLLTDSQLAEKAARDAVRMFDVPPSCVGLSSEDETRTVPDEAAPDPEAHPLALAATEYLFLPSSELFKRFRDVHHGQPYFGRIQNAVASLNTGVQDTAHSNMVEDDLWGLLDDQAIIIRPLMMATLQRVLVMFMHQLPEADNYRLKTIREAHAEYPYIKALHTILTTAYPQVLDVGTAPPTKPEVRQTEAGLIKRVFGSGSHHILG